MKKLLLIYPLISFFVLTFLISTIFQFSWVATSLGWIPNTGFWKLTANLKVLGNFGPMFAAMIMAYIEPQYSIKELFSKLTIWKAHLKWYMFALLFTVIQSLIAMQIYQAFVGNYPPIPSDYSIVLLPIILLIQFFTVGISEEMGWRGYALPKLQSNYNSFISSLILGILWGVWHYASFLVPGTFHATVPIGWYLVDIIAATIIFTWLFNNTKGSLLIAVLFHIAIDATVGYLPYFYDYNGIQLTVMVNVVIAICLLGKRKITFEQYVGK